MFAKLRLTQSELFNVLWLAATGLVFSFVASGGLKGFTLSLLFVVVSGLMVRKPVFHLYQSNAVFYFCIFTGVVIYFSAIVKYVFLREYTVAMMVFALTFGVSISLVSLYLRAASVRYLELSIFLIFICLGFVFFNLAIVTQVSRDVIIKESLSGVSRDLSIGSGGHLYFGRFMIENHLAIPNISALGMALLFASIHLRSLMMKIILVGVGLASLIPSWYTASRGPIVAFGMLLPFMCIYAFRVRHNRAYASLALVVLAATGAVLIVRDFTILTRFLAIFYEGDGRFILWANGLKKLFGATDAFMFSDWAHNYIIDMGFLLGLPTALLLAVMGVLLAWISVRLLIISRMPLPFWDALLLWFLITGFLLSMIQPPNTGLHIFYGIFIVSLPYLYRIAALQKQAQLRRFRPRRPV